MRKWKSLLAVSAIASMLVVMCACGNKETSGDDATTPVPTQEATKAPETVTDTPVVTDEPTVPEMVVVHSLDGEKKRDTLYFGSRGSGTAMWGTFGKDSEGSIWVTGRSANWHGVSLSFLGSTGEEHNVIGKEVYVSFDLYHESGAPVDFSCTLQVLKPDGSQGWPERVEALQVPSGEWVHVEGTIPVYANAASPSLNFETTSDDSSKIEFWLDNVTISYDKNSSVDPSPDYEPAPKLDFENVALTFSKNTGIFTSRGSASVSVVDGAMYVSGRTANWEGAQTDFSAYDLAGKTIEVSFKAKHDESYAVDIKCSIEEKDENGTSTYNGIAGAGVADAANVEPGEWVSFTGSYTISEATVAPIVYFETGATESFYIDDVKIVLAGTTIEFPVDEPAEDTPVAPVETSGYQVNELATAENGHWGVTIDGTKISYSGQYAEAKLMFPETISVSDYTSLTVGVASATDAYAIKLYDTSDAQAHVVYDQSADGVIDFTTLDQSLQLSAIGLMANNGACDIVFTGITLDGGAATAPAEDGSLVVNFADLTAGGYGCTATPANGIVSVDVSGQYQEVQYTLPETVDLAQYSKLVVTLVTKSMSDADALAIKLVNPDAELNQYGNPTEFACIYNVLSDSTFEIDLSSYADYDMNQIFFMASAGATAFTLTSVAFVK